MLFRIEPFAIVYIFGTLIYISICLWIALLLDENLEQNRLRGSCMNRELTNLIN